VARLYTNENFPQPAVEALRRLGHDILTVSESGLAGQAMSDSAVLEFARREARIIVTLNRRHFVRLHQARPDHAGILVCTLDLDFAAQAQRIHAALNDHPIMQGQLLRVNRPRQ
jgi:hypothetical protein